MLTDVYDPDVFSRGRLLEVDEAATASGMTGAHVLLCALVND